MHYKLRNLRAEILGEICKNVVIEPLRTPLMGGEFPKSSYMGNQAREISQLEGCELTSIDPFVT